MANAIKKISVQRGHDVTRYTLQCFGGAGGQHACRGRRRARHEPRASSIRSPACCRPTAWAWPTRARCASGRSRPPLRRARSPALGARARPARRGRARRSCCARASRAGACGVHRRVHLRYEGTDTALVVPFGERRRDPRGVRGGATGSASPSSCRTGRSSSRRCRSRRSAPAMHAERAAARARSAPSAAPAAEPCAHVQRRPLARRAGSSCAKPARPGDVIAGPAIIAEANATTVVEPGWQARVTALDHLLLDRVAARASAARHRHRASTR